MQPSHSYRRLDLFHLLRLLEQSKRLISAHRTQSIQHSYISRILGWLWKGASMFAACTNLGQPYCIFQRPIPEQQQQTHTSDAKHLIRGDLADYRYFLRHKIIQISQIFLNQNEYHLLMRQISHSLSCRFEANPTLLSTTSAYLNDPPLKKLSKQLQRSLSSLFSCSNGRLRVWVQRSTISITLPDFLFFYYLASFRISFLPDWTKLFTSNSRGSTIGQAIRAYELAWVLVSALSTLLTGTVERVCLKIWVSVWSGAQDKLQTGQWTQSSAPRDALDKQVAAMLD